MNTEFITKLEGILKSLLQLKETNWLQIRKPKELLNTADLTLLFNNTERTIQRWRKSGQLKCVKISGSVYYHFEDVLLLLQLKNGKK